MIIELNIHELLMPQIPAVIEELLRKREDINIVKYVPSNDHIILNINPKGHAIVF